MSLAVGEAHSKASELNPGCLVAEIPPSYKIHPQQALISSIAASHPAGICTAPSRDVKD